MGFRLVPKSVTLNDLERRNSSYFALFHRIRWIRRPIRSKWLKIDLYTNTVPLPITGATTAESWGGPRFGSQHQRSGWALGAGGGLRWVSGGITPLPRKIFENSDAKSCILVTTCCEISCFLKTTTNKLGDQYIVGPQPKSWATSLPQPLQLLRLCFQLYLGRNWPITQQ